MSRMRIKDIEIRDADIFEILLDNFPDMIHSIDDEGNIVYTNKTAESLLGYTCDELLGMNIKQIYAKEVLEELEKGFSDLKQRGDKTVESKLQSKDGKTIPVEIRSFSIYDDEGNFIRTFSILRDIRDIKDLQQSLVHAGRLAAIGELSSGVAHDINNPLTVILLANEMIARELQKLDIESGSSLDRIKSQAEDIQRASRSIQKLANHLRNFSRGMVENFELVDLFDTVEDSLFITKNKVQKSGVTVHSNLRKGEYLVKGCPNHLEQVFVNIIGNACDAMTESSKKDLTINAKEIEKNSTGYWKLDINDTGAGIPPEVKDEVFQSFFTTKEKGKGTGLGLSISRGIIKDHKGDIEVNSEPGTGATFSIILPKAQS